MEEFILNLSSNIRIQQSHSASMNDSIHHSINKTSRLSSSSSSVSLSLSSAAPLKLVVWASLSKAKRSIVLEMLSFWLCVIWCDVRISNRDLTQKAEGTGRVLTTRVLRCWVNAWLSAILCPPQGTVDRGRNFSEQSIESRNQWNRFSRMTKKI